MFTSSGQSSSQESAGLGMRMWLYLGAVAVGLSLMSLEDRAASDRIASQPEPTTASAIAASVIASSTPDSLPSGKTMTAAETGAERSLAVDVSVHHATISAN